MEAVFSLWSSQMSAAPQHPGHHQRVLFSFVLGGSRKRGKGVGTRGKSQEKQLHSEGELVMHVSTHLPVLWMQVSFAKRLVVV